MTGRLYRVLASAAALGVAGALLAACGVPTETTARDIPAGQVPFHLLSPSSPAPAVACAKGCVPVSVYFVTTGRYVTPETRNVLLPGSVTEAVDVLLNGPTTKELQSGIQTALGGGIKLISSRKSGNVVTLDFNPSFVQLSGSQEVLGVAQVVFTVAARLSPEIGVLFEIGGYGTDVPTATGRLVSAPVHESQYASLLAPGATTPGTTS